MPQDSTRGRARRLTPTALTPTALTVTALAVLATSSGVALQPEPAQAAAFTSAVQLSAQSSAQVSGPSTVLAVGSTLTFPGKKKALPYPDSGHSRVEVAGIDLIGHSGSSKAAPIASVTKIMTAYIVLRDHPLSTTASGPKITVSKAEAAAYVQERAAGDSVIEVTSGEKITEKQALQGLLLASGDNAADLLGRWDAGSKAKFVTKMNANAARLKMTSTHYADTSGLAAGSKSTTVDLLKLAPKAMADKTFAKIVAEKSATIPLNKMTNYNKLLGQDGVIGIKTGSTHAAGGCLVFAAHHTVSGHTLTIYGAVLGAPGTAGTILPNALSSSDALIVAAEKSLKKATLIPAGEPVVTVTDASGVSTNYTIATDYTAIGWAGLAYQVTLPKGLKAGQIPASVTVVTPGAQKVVLPLIKALPSDRMDQPAGDLTVGQ